MCLNCGCGMWDDDMGKKENITLTKLAEAALAENIGAKDTLENMKEAANQIKPEELDKKIDELKR